MYTKAMLGAAIAVLGAAPASAQELNGPDHTLAARPEIVLPVPTRGVVFKTAAINSNGTIANCFRCASAASLGGGAYQVIFDENVQAANGWSRWVQVDTLTTGSIDNVSCTTADRSGNVNGVFVFCHTGNTNASTPTSFFLFVAR